MRKCLPIKLARGQCLDGAESLASYFGTRLYILQNTLPSPAEKTSEYALYRKYFTSIAFMRHMHLDFDFLSIYRLKYTFEVSCTAD